MNLKDTLSKEGLTQKHTYRTTSLHSVPGQNYAPAEIRAAFAS